MVDGRDDPVTFRTFPSTITTLFSPQQCVNQSEQEEGGSENKLFCIEQRQPNTGRHLKAVENA